MSEKKERMVNRLEDGVYHISAQFFYRKPAWFLDRVKLNQCHVVLYKNGDPVARIVPMNSEVSPCEADYGLQAYDPSK